MSLYLRRPLHAATDLPNTGQIAAVQLNLLGRAFDEELVSLEINDEAMKTRSRPDRLLAHIVRGALDGSE